MSSFAGVMLVPQIFCLLFFFFKHFFIEFLLGGDELIKKTNEKEQAY